MYLQMVFKFTWSEFCLMETYFKTKLAELLLQDNGEPINATQINLINFDDNCPAKNNVDKASLLFYVIKADGTVDKDMTKQAFNVLYYLVENNLGRLFGPVFELKVTWLISWLSLCIYLFLTVGVTKMITDTEAVLEADTQRNDSFGQNDKKNSFTYLALRTIHYAFIYRSKKFRQKARKLQLSLPASQRWKEPTSPSE